MDAVIERSNPASRAAFQQKYLSSLIGELRRRRIERGSRSVMAVKAAADVSLAVAARGRTAWSRAIILAQSGKKANRHARALKIVKYRRNVHLHLKSLRPCNSKTFSSEKKLRKPSACKISRRSHGEEEEEGGEEEEQGVESRIKTLRTLVPGSRGLDTPVLLEEVADYITALKIQVDSMQTLARHLENSANNASGCRR